MGLSIAKKIWLSIGILITGYLCSMVFGFLGGRHTELRLKAVSGDIFPAAILSQSAYESFGEQTKNCKDAVMVGETSLLNAGKVKAEETLKTLRRIEELGGISAERRIEVKRIAGLLEVFNERSLAVYTQMITSVESDDLPPKALRIQNQRQQLHDDLQALSSSLAEELKRELGDVSQSTRNRQILNLLVFAVAVGFALILSYLIVSRAITRPLERTVCFAENLASGDLSDRIELNSHDEIGDLGSALNTMAGQLNESIDELMRHREHLEELVRERTRELELDIARREQAEKRFKTAFHSNANFMLITNIDDGTIVEANEAFRRRFGWSAGEIEGKTLDEIEFYADVEDETEINERSRNVGNIREREVALNTRRGERLVTLFSCDVITIDDASFMLLVCLDITERKKAEAELAEANERLVETALLAGKAEVATEVLHNVGNVLNSVGITSHDLRQRVRRSQLSNMARLAHLLSENEDRWDEFVTTDRGRRLPVFVSKLVDVLEEEQRLMMDDLDQLTEHVQHISEIVSLQQTYSSAAGLTEMVTIDELIKNALRINVASINKHDVNIDLSLSDLPVAKFDRHKIMQILINLITNAIHATAANREGDRDISIHVEDLGEDRIAIHVKDNGMGIAKENIDRIFTHGFTTKEDGHGFGLHSGANAAKQMGGQLRVTSDGLGKGAHFILELPFKRGMP